MQSRQPRLGDILDDYCPRERRLTNHAVVAMIGDEIKQTRCTTCDAEHEYKHAKVPAPRKKKTGTGALYDEVLAGGPGKLAAPAAPAPIVVRAEGEASEPAVPEAPAPIDPFPAPAAPEPALAAPRPGEEADGPVHRPLIRATLPRPEGQVKERPIPEFTARTAATRPGRFRPQGGQGHGGGAQGRPRGGQPQGSGGHQSDGNRVGRRGHGQFAAAGAPGNRAQGPQGDRQGHRRRGGRHRSK